MYLPRGRTPRAGAGDRPLGWVHVSLVQVYIIQEKIMSIPYSYEQYLLAVTTNNDNIVLRIDRSGWTNNQVEGMPIAEVLQTACTNGASVLEKLNNSTGMPIDYQVVKDSDNAIVILEINHNEFDEIRVNCRQIDETLTDFTLDDLKSKTNRLAELYNASIMANELGDFIYQVLKNTLLKTIQKEIANHHPKIEFFSKTNPEKAAILTGEVQAYQKVLALSGLGEIDGESIAPQIRQAISQIWSDTVWHQATYAALVESKIANMKQAALFPLLEIIKQPNSWYMRDEAILILGLIDAEVKENLVKVIQPHNKPA